VSEFSCAQMVIDALRDEDKDKRRKILHRLFDGYAAICGTYEYSFP
jgi:hypothetical protein